ncbi:MAG TPA: preprotein translocase subunit SecG [Sphaerochaeta sp.]|nr:preprotein translocase subunit SecG [Sphaerochaeta sp.]
MGVLSIILLVLFVIVSLLLVFLIAIQDEQSEGLGGIFGGGSQTTFGSRTGNVVNRATGTLAILFLVLALLVAFVNKSPSKDTLLESVTTEEVTETTEWWTNDSGPAN